MFKIYLKGRCNLKICSGFGHREVLRNIDEEIELAVENAIQEGCTLFYTGAMGEFDTKFSSAVRKAKRKYTDLEIKLVCVKPYLTSELSKNREYYYTMYDDIVIPTEIADVHYKQVISKRNEWIIDKSEIVIIFNVREYGGSYNALKYATKKNKTIIKI